MVFFKIKSFHNKETLEKYLPKKGVLQ
jgi:hypothetical protein